MLKDRIAEISRCVWEAVTTKKVTLYQLENGSQITDWELETPLEALVVATATMKRKTPLSSWQLDRDTIKLEDLSS